MRGEFYTERDIVDLVRRGVRSLELREGDRITDLARERARKEGLKIIWPDEAAEAPPHRHPPVATRRGPAPRPAAAAPSGGGEAEALRQRVRASVLARLGPEVDPALVDEVIRRVLDRLGVA